MGFVQAGIALVSSVLATAMPRYWCRSEAACWDQRCAVAGCGAGLVVCHLDRWCTGPPRPAAQQAPPDPSMHARCCWVFSVCASSCPRQGAVPASQLAVSAAWPGSSPAPVALQPWPAARPARQLVRQVVVSHICGRPPHTSCTFRGTQTPRRWRCAGVFTAVCCWYGVLIVGSSLGVGVPGAHLLPCSWWQLAPPSHSEQGCWLPPAAR